MGRRKVARGQSCGRPECLSGYIIIIIIIIIYPSVRPSQPAFVNFLTGYNGAGATGRRLGRETGGPPRTLSAPLTMRTMAAPIAFRLAIVHKLANGHRRYYCHSIGGCRFFLAVGGPTMPVNRINLLLGAPSLLISAAPAC